MRVLLDSRDIINLVEHGRPTTPAEFSEYLRSRNHEIVLTFTNVRELASPLAAGADFLRIRGLLQSLEQLPHICMKEINIVAIELQAAVDAFNAGSEYQPCSPYVSRWDHTLATVPGQHQSPTDNWINFRLDEIVYYMNKGNPAVFAPPSQHLGKFRTTLQSDRDALRAGRAPARQHFVNAVKKSAATHGVALPNGREDEFVQWIYADPHRCPGLRLNHETYRALMSNYADIPETADFSDLAHIYGVPYVDAATLDRRMRHYCEAASRKIVRFGGAINYAARLYEDVADFMQLHP